MRVGAPDRIRTCGLRLRRPTLHLVELRALLRSEAGLRGRQSTNLANPGGKASPTDERARAPHAECALQASSRRTGASEVSANRVGGPGPRRSRHTVPTAASIPHLASPRPGSPRRVASRPGHSHGVGDGNGGQQEHSVAQASGVDRHVDPPLAFRPEPLAPGTIRRRRVARPDRRRRSRVGQVVHEVRRRMLASVSCSGSGREWTLSGDPETSAHIDKCSGIQCFRGGAEGQNRTADTMIFSHVLYRLSYLGTSKNTRCAFRPTTAQSAGAECVAQRRYQHIPQRNCGATGARVGPRGRAVHR